MNASSIRVVFDCVVFLQGAGRRTGPARICLDLVDAGIVQLCLSPDVMAEIEDVLHRPELLNKFPLLTSEASQMLLRTTRNKATLVTSTPKVLALPRDPNDEPYINLAVASKAHYLVTWDKDLLSLMTGHTSLCKQFRQKTRPLSVVDPAEFLRIIDTAQK